MRNDSIKRVLIVKVSSLGDVVHTQPVVADLHRAFPGVQVDWATDAGFADLVSWNPDVKRVLYAPLRRFKKAREWSDLRAIASSIGNLRAERYDFAFDVHGVYKSAIISFLSRSRRRFGYPNQHLGERGAAFAYTDRFAPTAAGLSAWQGIRASVAQALGYSIDTPPRFNLQVPAGLPTAEGLDTTAPYAILFHATSSEVKKWPVQSWIELSRTLVASGLRVLLPWGSEQERVTAAAIAAGVPSAELLPRLTLTECAQLIGRAALVVGTDTGLVHLAHALERPTVMLFIATSRQTFGIEAPARTLSIGDAGMAPSVEEVVLAIERVTPAKLHPARQTFRAA